MKKIIPLLMLLPTLGLADNGWLSGGIFSMTQADIAQLLSMGQITTPTNPPNGFNALYFKADNHLYMLDSSGNETQVDGGGGGGANVYLSNLESPTAINQSLLFDADNTYDIGADGASRPGAIHAANHITAPLLKGRDNVIGAGQHDITVRGGDGTTGNKDGGILTLSGGAGSGTGVAGDVVIKSGGSTRVTVSGSGSVNIPGLTASQVVVTDASKNLTSLSRGNLSESTSSVLTITGGTNAVLDSGTTIQVKQSSGSQDGYLSQTDWSTFNGKMSNPMTTAGDIIVGGASGSPNRLALGTVDKVLVSDGTTVSYQYAGLGGGSLGTGNIVLGRAKPASLSGTNNTIVGVSAATSISTGADNVIIGTSAAANMTSGGGASQNIAIGSGAGASINGNSIAIGYNSNTVGQSIAIGSGASSTNYGLAVGYNSSSTSGIALGHSSTATTGVAIQGTSSGSYGIAIGGTTANYLKGIAIGNSTYSGNGDNNIAIGHSTYASWVSGTGGADNLIIGNSCGNNYMTGASNTVIGNSSFNLAGSGGLTSAARNTILGQGSGTALKTGSDNILIGQAVAPYLDQGTQNVLIGKSQTGVAALTTNSNSVAIGYNTATESAGSIAIGGGAIAGWNGGSNQIAIGYLAKVITSNNGIVIGANSTTNGASNSVVLGDGITIINSSNNTVLGYHSSMSTSASGGKNTFLGSMAGNSITSGESNLFLGYYSGKYSTTQSNEFFVDNQDRSTYAGQQTGSIIYGVMNATAANQTLNLNAAVTVAQALQVGSSTLYKINQASTSTTDGAVTTLQTLPTTTDTTLMIETRIVGKRTSGNGSSGDGASYLLRVKAKNVGGVVTLSSVTAEEFEDVASWDANIGVSGTNVIVQVNGASSTNVSWITTTITQQL